MRTATVFNFLVESTLIGTLMMTGALLIRTSMRRSLGSRFIRALWLLVALRLLLPIALPNPIMNAIKPTLSLDAGIRPMADQIRTRVGDATRALYWKSVESSGSPTLREALRGLAGAARNGRLSWLVMVIYALGAAGVAGWMIAVNVGYRRELACRAPSEALLEKWRTLCRARGVARVPRLAVSDCAANACAVGCLRPVAVLPSDLPEDAALPSMACALAHLRLRTGLSALLRGLCLCVHWFNLLAWVCAHRARLDDALACDEWATKPLDSEARQAYAAWLIHQRDARFASPGIAALASCRAMNVRQLAARIRLVLHGAPPKPLALAAMSLVAALTLAFMFATDEQSSADHIPPLTSPPLSAADYDLTGPAGAEAYARAFLRLDGVNAGEASADAFVSLTEHGWQVSLYMPSGESCELIFDQSGRLFYYEDTNVNVSALRPLADPITADTAEGRAWCAYVSAFLQRYLPLTYDAYAAMEIASSGRVDGEEYLTIRLLDADGDALSLIDIQAAPTGRIYRFLPAEWETSPGA